MKKRALSGAAACGLLLLGAAASPQDPVAGEPVARQDTDAHEVEIGSLRLTIPGRWKVRDIKPAPFLFHPNAAERLRYTQFSKRRLFHDLDEMKLLAELPVPRLLPWHSNTGAELVVFHFGQNGAGNAKQVVRGWVEQFAKGFRGVLVDRRAFVLQGTTEQGDDYSLVDVFGTYLYDQGPTFRRELKLMPDMRMLAAILPTEDGPYYVKLTGPQRLVREMEDDFRTVVRGNPRRETLLDEDLNERAAVVLVRFELDEEQYPAEGAGVRLGGHQRACSNEGATFENLDEGTYELRVERIDDLRPVPPREIEVGRGKLVEVVIVLQRGGGRDEVLHPAGEGGGEVVVRPTGK